ncbi:hypothetical protein ACFLTP_04805 [Chloroflexota bacterium]
MKPVRPKNETPEQRFTRIVEPRTTAVLKKLKLLGNCSNKRLYSYSQVDIERIFSSINRQVREVRSKFDDRIQDSFKL